MKHEDCVRYLKDLENELQCSLPKLRSIIEERKEMESIIHAVSYSVKVCKSDRGLVALGDELESKVLDMESKLKTE